MAALLCLTFLSACAGPAGGTRDDEVSAWLRTLREAQQRGEVGSVEGFVYLFLPPPPTPLRDWPVTLIPLPAALEAAVGRSRERFVQTGRAPLTADALRQAQQPIVEYMEMLRATGHSDLIRTAKTDTGKDPKFSFQDVPQGRWLLLAALPSSISVLLWAVPVTVTDGEVVHRSLNDQAVWLEALTK
jgi:hypothetical protein